MVPRILIFSIIMGANYSSKVKIIDTRAPTFFKHDNLTVATLADRANHFFVPNSLLKLPYFQAFGRAAHNLLPDLVHAWVTGGQSSKKSPSARLNDDELEPRIIAGKILPCT